MWVFLISFLYSHALTLAIDYLFIKVINCCFAEMHVWNSTLVWFLLRFVQFTVEIKDCLIVPMHCNLHDTHHFVCFVFASPNHHTYKHITHLNQAWKHFETHLTLNKNISNLYHFYSEMFIQLEKKQRD